MTNKSTRVPKVIHVNTTDLADREIPHISDEVAEEALAVMTKQMREGTVKLPQYHAARHLAQLYNTQLRIAPERLNELAASRPSSDVRDLTNLTIDELNRLTEEMLGKTG